jgi:hypothetical protein
MSVPGTVGSAEAITGMWWWSQQIGTTCPTSNGVPTMSLS